MARAWATLAEPCQFAQNRDIRHGGVGGHDESTSHVCVRTPFELEWTDSEMAEGSWRWDQMHNPTPLSPLSIEMSDLVLESLGPVHSSWRASKVSATWTKASKMTSSLS